MKRFYLFRQEDETGVSGCGRVADGIQFHTGQCVICWRTKFSSIAMYASIEDVKNIHGHNGSTQIVWQDQ